ncbi:MAG TPA: DUF4870 domain-containing protein, partial [Verrucomicrobiae bacterium]|nr:DUF4870 domain-containing protein [Verrucomicrobiae bacterium]
VMGLFFLSDLSAGIAQAAGEESMVGHWAHLGGMISGMLIAGRLRLGEDAVEERHLEIGLQAADAAYGYEGGERSLQIALERSPDNPDAIIGMARLKTKFRPTPEGADLYEKGMRLLMKTRPAEVLEIFREYFSMYRTVPEDPQMVWWMAEALRKGGEPELCAECLERLVEMPEVAPHIAEKALFQLGTLTEYLGRFEAAQRVFARFAATYPGSVLAEKAREKGGDASYSLPRAVPRKIDLGIPAPPAAAPPETPQVEACPSCGSGMQRRKATGGARAGETFMVCSSYPQCRIVHPLPPVSAPEGAAPAAVPPRGYRVVFTGELTPGSHPGEVKEKIARLFGCPAQRAEQLLRSPGAVLKKGLDRESAVALRSAFLGAGGMCRIEEEGAAAAAASAPHPPANAPSPRIPAVACSGGAPSAAARLTVRPASFSCPKCGELQEKGASCVRCGVFFAKLAGAAERDFQSFRDHVSRPAAPAMSEAQERRWAMLCHLLTFSGWIIPLANIAAPLAVWLWKRKDSEFVDFHGKVSLNYQLTLMIFGIGIGTLAAVTGIVGLIIGPGMVLLGGYTLVMVITSSVKAARGDYVEIGLSAHIIK